MKIIDFGLARKDQKENSRLIIGTMTYMAPEIFKYMDGKIDDYPYTPECDMYALGCVMYLLLVGKLPFSGENLKKDAVNKHVSFNQKAWRKVSEQGKEMVKSLLSKDPSMRMTAEEAINHEFINQGNEGVTP